MKRTITILGALAALVPVATAQNVEFDTPWRAYDLGNYPEGTPWDSEMADFDGDGNLDLASVSWGFNGRLAILFGNGRGGFERLTRYPLSSSSMGMAVADFDGDSDPDIAVANTGFLWDGSTVSVFLNQGGGNFLEVGPYFVGVAPTGITAADFDGDGDFDLAAAHDQYITSGTSYARLDNNGDGTFGAAVITTLPSTSFQTESADLNGDGRPDLVVAGEMHDLSVLLNSGDGFEPPVAYLAMPQRYQDVYPCLELADVDLDGDVDVLYSATNATIGTFGGVGQVGVLRNNGDGSFAPVEYVPMLFREGGAIGLTVADVTEDGWPDILAAHGARDFWGLLPGNGTGGFHAIQQYWSGDGPINLHAEDVDVDGIPDVVAVAANSITAAVHLNVGGGVFPAQAHMEMVAETNAPASYSRASSSDVDGDGDTDIVVGYSINYEARYGISVALNQGDGTFARAQSYPTSTFPEKLELADLDGDGDEDAVWVDDGFPFNLGFCINEGGVFGAAQAGPSLPTEADCLSLFDVDGDGRAEALVGGALDQVNVARFNGTTFEPFYVIAINNIATAIGVDDLNGDGNPDLITNSAIQGWLEVCIGNGDGTFNSPWTVQAGFSVAALVVADVNGDGIPDIATANDNDVTMTVLIGRGPGLFKPPVSYSAGRSGYYGFQSIDACDSDGDGDVDLFASNFGSQDISFWRNRGDGTFDHHVRLGVGQGVWDTELADFTGDGVVDLVSQVELTANNGWYYPAITMIAGTAGDPWTDLGNALIGTRGAPVMRGLSTMQPGLPFVIRVDNALENTGGVFLLGGSQINTPILGGVMVPRPDFAIPVVTDAMGAAVLAATWGSGSPSGLSLYTQAWLLDPATPGGLAASNGLRATTP